MVAHLLRLKLALLRNGFRRSPWQLVGVVLGGAYGLFLTALLLAGLAALGSAEAGTVRTVLVLSTGAAAVGWALVPVVLTGLDMTLDPARFATFTIPRRQLVAGLLLGGFVGVPGAVTLLLFVGQALAWRAWPPAALAAAVCGALGAVLCLALARLCTTAAQSLTGRRRFRDLTAVLVAVPLVLLGPALVVVGDGIEGGWGTWIPRAAGILAWTPLGSFAAVPADVAAGDWAVAALRFALSCGYLAGIVLLWQSALFSALEAGPGPGGSTRSRAGLGLFARFPATPWGAVAARCLTYWLKDPRYAAAVVVVPLLPVLLAFAGWQSGDVTLLLYLGPIIGVLMAFSISADVSYDSTAFALHAAAGVRGIDDRIGRVVACAALGLPATLAAAVLPASLTGRADLVPALLGASLGALLTGLGVSSVSSARFTYAVPQPGESPFKTPPGTGVRMMVVQLATMAVMGILLLPDIVLFAAGLLTGSAAYGWVLLFAGPAVGALLLVAGVRLGGRWMDSRLPELMQATVLNR